MRTELQPDFDLHDFKRVFIFLKTKIVTCDKFYVKIDILHQLQLFEEKHGIGKTCVDEATVGRSRNSSNPHTHTHTYTPIGGGLQLSGSNL